MTDSKFTQRLLDFGAAAQREKPAARTKAQITAPTAPGIMSQETLEAFEQLEGWLRGPDGKTVTTTAETTLTVVRLALVAGKNGYVQRAEDLLELLQRNNGRTQGEDIASGEVPEGWDFHQTIETLLDALAERVTFRGLGHEK